MSFKAPSIKHQFENRNRSNEFRIQWSHDRNINPIEGKRFGKEVEEFVKEVNVVRQDTYIKFNKLKELEKSFKMI
eukprot:maker-scaffold_57-snap-gene-1.9-mRNA-1 protein AED:0.12 eAED:0.12 QI:110/0.5/0.33/1/1/1/3/0/74